MWCPFGLGFIWTCRTSWKWHPIDPHIDKDHTGLVWSIWKYFWPCPFVPAGQWWIRGSAWLLWVQSPAPWVPSWLICLCRAGRWRQHLLAAAELQSWQGFTVRDSGGHLHQPLQSRALWGLYSPFLKNSLHFWWHPYQSLLEFPGCSWLCPGTPQCQHILPSSHRWFLTPDSTDCNKECCETIHHPTAFVQVLMGHRCHRTCQPLLWEALPRNRCLCYWLSKGSFHPKMRELFSSQAGLKARTTFNRPTWIYLSTNA